MTTDLRAALREALNLSQHQDFNARHAAYMRLVEISIAPPTVAELLPLVDATHEVRWTTCGEERRIYSPDGGALVVVYRTGRAPNHYTSWHHMDLTVHDLTQPATLVEVTP